MEVLKSIQRAEEQAEGIRREASTKAREMVQDALDEQSRELRDAQARIKQDAARALSEGQENVARELEAMSELRKRQADEEKDMEARLDQAAGFLYRKVVNDVVPR